MECDVLVVGAGPAGSSAARACALAGLKTIFVDKRTKLGTPVHCAEGIGQCFFPFLPFKIPQEQLIWDTAGIEFWAEDIIVRRTGILWKGCTVNRKHFDKWVAAQATNAGAKLMLNTHLIDFEVGHNNTVKKATLNSEGKTIHIEPKVVVGADGYDSTTLRLLGEYREHEGTIAEVYSWEMHNVNLASPNFEQVYVGDFTDTGYAYVFPISKSKANIGVGCAKPKKPMEDYFREFLEIPEMKHQVKNATKIENKGGKVNPQPIAKKWVYGNVILTGDAADQNLKPFVEGILPAIICGDTAGKTTVEHIKNKKELETYEQNVKKSPIGSFFTQSEETGKLMYQLFDHTDPKKYLLLLLLIADLQTPQKIRTLQHQDYNTLRDEILTWNNPINKTIIKTLEYLDYKHKQITKK
ncbi:Digeranylgeranylglycerophospholipid reductase [uncultured archaeon]|nr:Digeranylgeranylglycerophospholipid reductase [uncultured archaeon]